MDYLELTAPCGLDCWNCRLYLAQEDPGLRQAIAKKTGRPEEACACPGCRALGGTIAFLGMKEPCKVWRCTEARGYLLCAECGDFPCDHLHPYADLAGERPHNTKVFNLCQIRKLGVAAWAEQKALSVRQNYFTGKLEL